MKCIVNLLLCCVSGLHEGLTVGRPAPLMMNDVYDVY